MQQSINCVFMLGEFGWERGWLSAKKAVVVVLGD
jgi:hypothetical protein